MKTLAASVAALALLASAQGGAFAGHVSCAH